MIDSVGAACGRMIAKYGQAVITAKRTHIRYLEPLSRRPCGFICWHSANLIALTAHERLPRPGMAVSWMPSGLAGSAMRGLLRALQIVPVALTNPDDVSRALREARAGVARGNDVLIAVDGPLGPSRQVKPVALWLVAKTGAEIRPFGCAAKPSFRVPRWDRQIMPLPTARIVGVVGEPMRFAGSPRSAENCRSVARMLDELNAEALQLLDRPRSDLAGEYALWK